MHRVAAELLIAADKLRQDSVDARPWALVTPRDARRPLPLATVQRRQGGLFTWQPWEQLDLPRLARGGALLNLCNLAPVLHPACAVMMHDAQVFSSPESYSPQFRLLYRTLQPLLGKTSAKVLTVSAFSKAQLVHYGVASAEKVHVVPNGCDHLRNTPPDRTALEALSCDGRPFILALATTQAHKNVGLLLKTFARRKMADYRLVLVGKADAAAFEAAGFKVPDTVRFAGPVSDGGFRALFEAAHGLAFPSLTEGFGLPPMEAMSLGCPVVAAPCGALPEVCGEAAAYAAPDDEAAWELALRRLVEDAGERSRRIDAGYAQAARFSWAASAAKLLEVTADL